MWCGNDRRAWRMLHFFFFFFFFLASVASVCLLCSYMCVSRPPHKSCRSVGSSWGLHCSVTFLLMGRLRGTHVWQPWSTTKSFHRLIFQHRSSCYLYYISFPFAKTPLVLASKYVMNTNYTGETGSLAFLFCLLLSEVLWHTCFLQF